MLPQTFRLVALGVLVTLAAASLLLLGPASSAMRPWSSVHPVVGGSPGR